MTTDDRIGRVLATVADDLRPEPDPYGRVLARRRRSDRRRAVAVVASVLVVALGVTATAFSWTRAAAPPAQGEGDRQFTNEMAWARKLADGPTHGALANDKALVTALSDGIMRNSRAGKYDVDHLAPVARVAVPFVDDVGPYRLAFVVLVYTKPDERKWPFASQWLYGPRGADAATLLTTGERIGHGIEPLSAIDYSSGMDAPRVSVAVVPPQCRFATTTAPADPQWTPEPTGSYIVRTEPTTLPEWWRVDCGGDVRAELPAPNRRLAAGEPTDAQLDAAVAGMRVQADRAVARQCLLAAAQPGRSPTLRAMPTLVWIGEYAGSPSAVSGGLPPSDRAAVAVTPVDKGGWVVQFLSGTSTGSYGWTSVRQLAVADDPTRPDTVFVLKEREDESPYLVVPPTGAVSVRALYRGQSVGEEPVTGGAARLDIPVPFDKIEALGPGGEVLGQGAPAAQFADYGIVSRWGEE
jgi:hypothetical protein